MHIIDVRDKMGVATGSGGPPHGRIGTARKTSATLHWNGPAVGDQQRTIDAWIAHLAGISDWHRWGTAAWKAWRGDGICYHYAVLPHGQVLRLRDDHDILWHAADAHANAHSLAVHFPLGRGQAPTRAQWAAAEQLLGELGAQYGFNRQAVRGHQEWAATDCPGPAIMERLHEYRAAQPVRWYVVLQNAPVRTAPADAAPIVRHVQSCEAYVLLTGHQIEAQRVSADYAWWATGIGFVALRHLMPIEPGALTTDSAIVSQPRITEAAAIAAITSRDTGEYTRTDIAEIIVPHYVNACDQVGVDPLVALAQMSLETGNLTSRWAARPHRNPAGIGVTGEPGAGASFPSWVDAIHAHVGRLVAYATRPEQRTGVQQTAVARALAWRPLPDRFHGGAPTIAGLATTWAADPDYAGKIVRVASWMQGARA